MEKLQRRFHSTGSLLCIGLDPTVNDLNSLITLIDQTHQYAIAYKANSAYFEQFGPEGMANLSSLRDIIPHDIPLIIDCKRGDIGTSSDAYARAMFEHCQADAITVSPWMGRDSIQPFIDTGNVFVLCKTSNPGSADLQDLILQNGYHVYEHLAKLVTGWGENVGLVVGATSPDAIKAVRTIAPNTWLLCPGIGAQGGDLEQTVKNGLTDFGGVLVSVGRGISESVNPGKTAKEYFIEIKKIIEKK